MGKHSGAARAAGGLAKIGYAVGTYDLLEAFKHFKVRADVQGELFEGRPPPIMRETSSRGRP
jgi:hypothetical protein